MAPASDILARTPTVSAAREAFEGLISLAFTDPLTGLHNRRALDEVMRLPLGFDLNFGAVMLDLTGFKRVNDEGTHAAGDAALGRVGNTLKEMCRREGPRAGALPFRYGGDEFCLLVPDSIFSQFTELSNLGRLRWPDFTVEGKSLGFGTSIGIADPAEDIGWVQLIKRADLASKASKRQNDEPIHWSPSIEEDEMVERRKRCASCAATISMHIARSALVPDALKSCPNCGAALP